MNHQKLETLLQHDPHLDLQCSTVHSALPGCFGFSGLGGPWRAFPGSWQSLCGGGPGHRPQTGTSSSSSLAPSCCTAGSRRVNPAHESEWRATAVCWNFWMSCRRLWNLKARRGDVYFNVCLLADAFWNDTATRQERYHKNLLSYPVCCRVAAARYCKSQSP